jgi:hypothetical protein
VNDTPTTNGEPPRRAAIHTRRCVRHAQREAVARCPGCGNYFCRECVVEHENRFLCANCLAREAHVHFAPARRWATVRRSLSLIAAALLGWACFYEAGRLLLKIPPNLHDVTWRSPRGPKRR